ncbi:hypothetical protein ACFSL6_25960 [Paenibacillus thailandensis]|uniref:hypothetical protein n=1 Tax=Paenibacillus thailandensis TaxID=393250 RepID=UPI0036402B5E
MDDRRACRLFAGPATSWCCPTIKLATSGSAILALSYYKRGRCAEARIALANIFAEGGGILYDPADPEGLRKALEQSVRLNREETEKHIAKKLAELDWKKIAGRMIHVYMANRNDIAVMEGQTVSARNIIGDDEWMLIVLII